MFYQEELAEREGDFTSNRPGSLVPESFAVPSQVSGLQLINQVLSK